MKSIILILSLVLMAGCVNTKPCITDPVRVDTIELVELVYEIDTVYIDTSSALNVDSILQVLNYTQIQNDSLAQRLLRSNLMIENARYYLRITIRNSSQDKFLKGWMRRALEM